MRAWQGALELPEGWKKGSSSAGLRFFFHQDTPNTTQWNWPAQQLLASSGEGKPPGDSSRGWLLLAGWLLLSTINARTSDLYVASSRPLCSIHGKGLRITFCLVQLNEQSTIQNFMARHVIDQHDK